MSPSTPSSPFDDFVSLTSSNIDLPVPEANHLPASRTTPNTPTISHNDSDDVLGLLGQPVFSPASNADPYDRPPSTDATSSRIVNTPVTGSVSASSTRPSSHARAARTPSPPPHILGQVVAMGFSVQQARLALAATLGSVQGKERDAYKRWNVQAAAEVLASDGAATAQMRKQGEHHERGGTHGRRLGHKAMLRVEERESGRNVSKLFPPRSPQNAGTDSSVVSGDDLLAHASSIGFSVLKSANAYWKTSKAQLAKALEEKDKYMTAQSMIGAVGLKSTSPAGSRAVTPGGGRPKWMTEDFDDPEVLDKGKGPAVAAFRDSDEEEDSNAPKQLSESKRNARRERPYPRQDMLRAQSSEDHTQMAEVSPRTRQPSAHPGQATLKSPDPEPRIYFSPNRRKAPIQVSSTAAAPPDSRRSRTPAPSLAPTPTRSARVTVAATSSELDISRQHRTSGNELFKLGRYGEAVEAYSFALASLPKGHLARVAILNNRANARLKIGEEKKSGEDAGAVLALLLGDISLESATKADYLSAISELSVPTVLNASNGGGTEETLDPKDALGKALSRRAKAHEASEKWRLAMLDWQLIVDLGNQWVLKSAGGMKVVSDGLARCRKVTEAPRKVPSNGAHIANGAHRTANIKPKSRAAVTESPTARPSRGVLALRENAVQAEAEDVERLRVKDSIDAKVQSWRGGKETNLRALIASLETVLWEGLGWKKVGMHELITDGQLKVRYVRAISKVHPDKVGSPFASFSRILEAGKADYQVHRFQTALPWGRE